MPTSIEKVEEDQIFAWNPNICGTKSVDTILINRKGNKNLTFTGNYVYDKIKYKGNMILRPGILIR